MDLFQMKDAVSHIKASDEFKQKTIHLLADQIDGRQVQYKHAPKVKSGHRNWVRSMALAAAVVVAVLTGILAMTNMSSLKTSDKNALTAAKQADSTVTGSVVESTEFSTASVNGDSEMMALGVSPETTAGAESKAPDSLLTSAACLANDSAVGRRMSYLIDAVNPLTEINGSLYYAKDDGSLLLYQSTDVSTQLMTVPLEQGEHVMSDGIYFYYSLSNVIYQFTADGSSSKDIWKADSPISLKHIDKDHIIFQYTTSDKLSNSYVIIDRKSGKSQLLLCSLNDFASQNGAVITNDSDVTADGSSGWTVSLLDVSDESAVLNIYGSTWDSLCTINLTTLKINQIYGASAIDASAIGNLVYFIAVAPDNSDATSDTDSNISKLYSVQSDGTKLSQIDLSAIPVADISGMAKSGDDVLLSVSASDTDNRVYLYQPLSSDITLQKDGLGYISDLFATDHYFTLSSQDLSGSGTNLTMVEKIIR